MNCTVLYGQHKKETYGRIYKKLSNELASEFHRSQFCFELNTGIVVEVDVCSYEEARLLIAEYIRFYNNERIQTKTKLTPLELRSQFVT